MAGSRRTHLTQHTLVTNPIYEGPQYETIENHLSSLQCEAAKRSERELSPHELEDSVEADSIRDDRYFKHPMPITDNSALQPQALLDFLTDTPSPIDPDNTLNAALQPCYAPYINGNITPTCTAHMHDSTRQLGNTAASPLSPLELPNSDISDGTYAVMSPAPSALLAGGQYFELSPQSLN